MHSCLPMLGTSHCDNELALLARPASAHVVLPGTASLAVRRLACWPQLVLSKYLIDAEPTQAYVITLAAEYMASSPDIWLQIASPQLLSMFTNRQCLLECLLECLPFISGPDHSHECMVCQCVVCK